MDRARTLNHWVRVHVLGVEHLNVCSRPPAMALEVDLKIKL